MKFRDFASGFAKGKLLECERIAFARSKDSFWSVKGKLSEAKTGIFRTILGSFWTKEKCPKICKPRFSLSIKHL